MAQVRQTAQAAAGERGWEKDSQLSRINGRDVYRGGDGNLYALDTQHGRFEMVDGKTGKHMDEVRLLDLQQTKSADTTGKNDGLTPAQANYAEGLVNIGVGAGGAVAVNRVLDAKEVAKATAGEVRKTTPDHLLPDNISGDGLAGRATQEAVRDMYSGNLPGRAVGGAGTPRVMPPATDSSTAAEEFAVQALGRSPAKADFDLGASMNRGDCAGCWRAKSADGTWVTYRPAGKAGRDTLPTTATVEVNNPSLIQANGGKGQPKFKFPQIGAEDGGVKP